MIFNFFLGNHHANALNSFTDLLLPIYNGLTEGGHHVIGWGTGLLEAPAVNVLVEWFEDDRIVDELLQTKAARGDRFVFGILCTEDMSDKLVMDPEKYPRRLINLMRLLPAADFVWTLLPQAEFFAKACAPDRVALVEYGFSGLYLDPDMITDARDRDVDAILYGNENPYRAAISRELERRGFSCFVSHRESWPNFMTDDIIRRAKVLLDVRRGPGVRFLSPTRIVKGLHSGTAVVSELFDRSETARLYRYTEAVEYGALADRCAEIIRSGKYVEMGLAALKRFQAETSMRDNMARAMALPVFDRLART